MKWGVFFLALLLFGCGQRPSVPPPAPPLASGGQTMQEWLTAREALAAFRVLERRGGVPEAIRFTVAKRRSELGGVVLELSDPLRPERQVLVDVGPDRQAAVGTAEAFRGEGGAFRLVTCLDDLAERAKEPLALLELRPDAKGTAVLAVGFPAMPGSVRTYAYDALGKWVGATGG